MNKISDKSKIKTLILASFGLFGFAGFHYFYTGKVILGFLFLFTIGGFRIGTIIDIIEILLGNFRDIDSNPIRN